MSLYRVMTYGEKPAPPAKDVEKILKNYVGKAGKVSKDRAGWMYVTLPGTQSFPFRHLFPDRQKANRWRKRWFEVRILNDYLTVITRTQDEFTNSVAEGTAKMLARFLGLEYKEPR